MKNSWFVGNYYVFSCLNLNTAVFMDLWERKIKRYQSEDEHTINRAGKRSRGPIRGWGESEVCRGVPWYHNIAYYNFSERSRAGQLV